MPVGGAVFAPANKYIYIYCARLNGRAFLCPGRAYKKRRKPAFYSIPPRWSVRLSGKSRRLGGVARAVVRFVASGRCLCGAVVVALSWGVSVRFFGYPVFWAFYWVVFRLFTLCEKVNI